MDTREFNRLYKNIRNPSNDELIYNIGIPNYASGGRIKKYIENENQNQDQDLSPEQLEEQYQEELKKALLQKSPSGLRFNTQEGGEGGINLIFGRRIRPDNYQGFGPRTESNIDPRINIRDPRMEFFYAQNPENQTDPKFNINIGPKGGYLGFTKDFKRGGIADYQYGGGAIGYSNGGLAPITAGMPIAPGYAHGGYISQGQPVNTHLTTTIPPVRGPMSQGVETLFKRRYS